MANKKRKKDNSFREWLSDNLRYLLLLLIVIIAALAAFLIYREFSDRRQAAGTETQTEQEAQSAETAASVSAEAASAVSESAQEEKTEVVTATPTPTETPTPTPTPEVEVTLSEEFPAVTEAVQNAFYSMQASGENENVEYYDSIHVQAVPGPTDGTYIAYTDYQYKYWNYDAMVPGLTWMYFEQGEDGALREVPNSQIPADAKAYIASVEQSDTIQELIHSVTEDYVAVMDANPELAEFVSTLE